VVLGHDDCHDPVACCRLDGQPRRVAIFDYSDPLIARMGPLVAISVIDGLILLVSAVLRIAILVRSQLGERRLATPSRYALAVNAIWVTSISTRRASTLLQPSCFVAILSAFAMLDAQHHAFGVDVVHLQRDNL
jgi:hypothetical protein